MKQKIKRFTIIDRYKTVCIINEKEGGMII